MFKEEGGILDLMPIAESEYAVIEKRDMKIFDNIKDVYEQTKKFSGARKIIGDWSLTKVENVNFEIISPYIEGKKVLEIGCGRGYMTVLLSLKASVVAFDISRHCLEYAKELDNLGNNVSYFRGNAYSVPFESDTFDIVVATEVLEHLPGLDKAMREINRVVKRGGLVVASVPNTMMYLYPEVLCYLCLTAKGRKYLVGRMRRQIDDKGQYHRPFLPLQFRRLFENYGFEVIRHRTSMCYFYRPPYDWAILWGDMNCPSVTKGIVKLIIRGTDLMLDRELPMIKWFGTRQHILARKVTTHD